MATTAPSTLKQLANLISHSVDQIDAACAARGTPFPSLDAPFAPETEAARNHPDVLQAVGVLVAAATQLVATAKAPQANLMTMATQCTLTACLGVANDSNVAEILREAGPEGAHVKDIVKRNGLDADRLGRVLRLLATNHIFKELAPDVFANNLLSSILDTGKPVDVILKDPEAKHDNTHGFSALIGHITDESFKTEAFLSETLRDRTFGHSDEPNQCALNLAFRTDLSAFAFAELPENRARLRRLGAAMHGSSQYQPPDSMLQGFDFAALKEDALVVDVAGGIGSVSMILANAFPKMRFVVEDRPGTVAEGEKFWKAKLPDALSSGRVQLIPHDMFTPQPTPAHAPAVFLLRQILHDWSDAYALRLLRHLRAAAARDTVLLVVDHALSHACAAPAGARALPGAEGARVPPPLLPNMGGAAVLSYSLDILMLALQNGQERTVPHFARLLARAGWELREMKRTDPLGVVHPHLVAVPGALPEDGAEAEVPPK
ncbi:S-adenosyl-L-methionine-dependent methyltransferase [Dentipellis sp. KUC8613]|nr:S-adenosyl-L-methionine-dependent methyltransferase [Dentipellis sp. KUC8613]